VGFRVIIPARYASTRLPGKPLRDIAGKPMIQHVYLAAAASGAESVVIATDDERIRAAAQGFGAEVQMTSAVHRSGSERLAEVAQVLGYGDDELLVNVQGDEPLMPPALVRQVAEDLESHPQANVATLCNPIAAAPELFDSNVVKVVRNQAGYALYFSRAPIPWDREAFPLSADELPRPGMHFKHIGLYAYRVGFLKHYVGQPACALEQVEALEQLRVLWEGGRIHVAEAIVAPGPGVDTEEDLAQVARLMGGR